ncbi:ANTAR domain-containing protein (plasmid) [Rhodococcus koreensis]|nr:ANTAR domain-containing protein [Rhodococcus koreensis]
MIVALAGPERGDDDDKPPPARPLEETSFRTQLEAAQRVVMTARRCTEDQAFDELLDVAPSRLRPLHRRIPSPTARPT